MPRWRQTLGSYITQVLYKVTQAQYGTQFFLLQPTDQDAELSASSLGAQVPTSLQEYVCLHPAMTIMD